MQWFRMYSEFATDPKVQSMDETFQRRFVMFLCMQCNGDFERLRPEELAFALRIEPKELQQTIDAFKAKGFLDEEGKIRNWNKRQYKSDSSTERVRKHRSSKGETPMKRFSNGHETPPDTDTEPEKDSERDKSLSGAERLAATQKPKSPTDGTDADPIWSLGVQILGASSRSVLGRLVKQYGREKVAGKIGELSAMAPRPVDPRAWLIGALKPREERPARFRTA